MPQLRVVCQHCQRVTLVDSEKVPDQPVSFKCPSCQGKVVLDKRRLLRDGGEAASAREAEDTASMSAANGAHDDGASGAAAVPRAAAAATARAAVTPGRPGAPATTPGAGSTADPVLELTLPPGATLPPCVIVAEEREVALQLQRVLEPFEAEVETFTDVTAARERIQQEPPPLVVWVAGAVGKPPHAPLDPIAGLPPRERRAILLVLVADNVKTLDGNLAFLYGVNLLLGRRHLPQAPGILYTALHAHRRLYRPFLAAVGE
jgi:hypothetical protein